ncbi:hypothetical protein L226DRAFT_524338 [Lentinus tigrinus ALCF2SS1-7]|uniref:Uncharacterized protein n=1 Tax=Lentinus tigrinus ALCF2SS1-6 TaxID=1328759 RepID=A0A5C2S1W8_9APHY|nr:hypothetical protein L227DRAFT_565751 [Lentinus tigrinus ALCF2SS1-6]RPD72848.1 hypothetical protein L226DRAFT_524338 [Lentinus tigrinus ALCF2SS1-7]
MLDRLTLLLDIEDIKSRAKAITNPELDQQLDWHQRNEGKDTTHIPVKSQISKKADKVVALCAAVDRYYGVKLVQDGLVEAAEREATDDMAIQSNGENSHGGFERH